jgi:hypothetical protein
MDGASTPAVATMRLPFALIDVTASIVRCAEMPPPDAPTHGVDVVPGPPS